MANVSPNGDLDEDSFLRALLHLRNTPDPDCDLSPAEIVFGRPLRDAFFFVNRIAKFTVSYDVPGERHGGLKKMPSASVLVAMMLHFAKTLVHYVPCVVVTVFLSKIKRETTLASGIRLRPSLRSYLLINILSKLLDLGVKPNATGASSAPSPAQQMQVTPRPSVLGVPCLLLHPFLPISAAVLLLCRRVKNRSLTAVVLLRTRPSSKALS